MIISIDYDDCYTRDPILWDTFIRSALARGHTVWCVSARSDAFMNEARTSIGKIIGPDHCLGTNGKAKRDTLFRERGVYADVFIDDMPETVTAGYDVGAEGQWVTQYDGASSQESE